MTRVFREERGATLVEYVLIALLILLVCLPATTDVGKGTKRKLALSACSVGWPNVCNENEAACVSSSAAVWCTTFIQGCENGGGDSRCVLYGYW